MEKVSIWWDLGLWRDQLGLERAHRLRDLLEGMVAALKREGSDLPDEVPAIAPTPGGRTSSPEPSSGTGLQGARPDCRPLSGLRKIRTSPSAIGSKVSGARSCARIADAIGPNLSWDPRWGRMRQGIHPRPGASAGRFGTAAALSTTCASKVCRIALLSEKDKATSREQVAPGRRVAPAQPSVPS